MAQVQAAYSAKPTPHGIMAQMGLRNNFAGQMAETRVADHYQQQGYTLVATRWRGSRGEIDLIAQKDGVLVFVEVKSAKTHARALESLSPAQQNRIMLTAQEFLATDQAAGAIDIRFDVTTVPHAGDIQVLENALIAA